MTRIRGTWRGMLALALWLAAAKGHADAGPGWDAGPASPLKRSVGFLCRMMDRYHRRFDIYTEVGAGGNHFACLARMPGEDSGAWMDVCCTGTAHSGGSSIECGYERTGCHWGGFYFLNGVMGPGDRYPRQNWGDEANAGYDLRGAQKLVFWARGRDGGERVEFFCGGVGWSVDHRGRSIEPVGRYPDSFPKVSTGFIRLSREWKQYTINLSGADLSYVIGGFGWVVDAYRNRGREDVVFYLDDIWIDLARTNDLRFMASFETDGALEGFDNIMRNVAFTYDNAVALIAFLAEGGEDSLRRARILAESLVYAAYHDRGCSGVRLRNAYMCGDLESFPGWGLKNGAPVARLPNFWDCRDQEVYEDRMAVSSYAGNVAWAMLALLAAHRHLGDVRYLQCAVDLGRWVVEVCRDERGPGGFTGGVEGWESDLRPVGWKATEHNIDLMVAFYRLAAITGDRIWLRYAREAECFVESMWDETEGKFWTGTLSDGITVNTNVVPLDVQTWSILAFGEGINGAARCIDYALSHHVCGGGADFNRDRDGIWYEGTAQLALAALQLGRGEIYERMLATIEKAQLKSGAVPAASRDGLTTGFKVSVEGNPDWVYYHRGHVGATAWYILARLKVNPFWF